MPSTASRNAVARNSGARKMRSFADTVSVTASATPPTMSFAASASTAVGSPPHRPASAMPHGTKSAMPIVAYTSNFSACAHSISARWRPEYSRSVASWIIVSSRCVPGLSTGRRAFSASITMTKATAAKARLGCTANR